MEDLLCSSFSLGKAEKEILQGHYPLEDFPYNHMKKPILEIIFYLLHLNPPQFNFGLGEIGFGFLAEFLGD